MKKAILIVGLVIAVIALSGCTQPEAGTVYKYVCSDGTIVDRAGLCPTEEGIDLEVVCVEYCETGQKPEANDVEYIKAEMDAANYCETAEDCVETDTKCPIGCYNIVNKAELDRINQLVNDFKQTCFQTCTPLAEFVCDNNKCMPTLYGTS